MVLRRAAAQRRRRDQRQRYDRAAGAVRRPEAVGARPRTRAGRLDGGYVSTRARYAEIKLERCKMASTAKSSIRVATLAGPRAKPVIETVPWPKIDARSALIKIGACGVCGTGSAHPEGTLAKAPAVAFHAGTRTGRRHCREEKGSDRGLHGQAPRKWDQR